jgi:hypothetical protein
MTPRLAVGCLVAGIGLLALMLLVFDVSGHLYGALGLLGAFGVIVSVKYLAEVNGGARP